MSTDSEDEQKAKFPNKAWLMKYWPLILCALMFAENRGWLTAAQLKEMKELVIVRDEQQQEPPAPTPAPAPKTDTLTPEQIADLIRQAIDAALKEKPPEPTPAEDATPAPIPQPVSQVRIKLCDEAGQELTDSEIDAGQLFRVSALGCGEEIGWHPVESGDVKLSASTDGKEFCGYLEAGQWVEFSLTDFASKTQASLRVTCLTAPQPPPEPDDDDKKPDPKPEPKAQNVRIFVVYNPDKISPDAAIVLNANEMWDGFTDAGNDWKWIGWETDDSDEKQIVRDASGIGLPAVVVYDKSTGKKLTAEELPKSVIATEGLVERYTGGK